MKFPKILSGTILTLALAASFDATFTSCSCSTSNIPEGWPKHCYIVGNEDVKINWSYPKKNEPLLINYELLNNYKTVSTSCRVRIDETSDEHDWSSSIITHTDTKIIEIPAGCLFSRSLTPYYEVKIGVTAKLN